MDIDPDMELHELRELAKMGLELAEAIGPLHDEKYHGSMFRYDTGKYCCALGELASKARAMLEKAGVK